MGKFKQIFTDWKIVKRILITIGFILLFRFGIMITIPGVKVDQNQLNQNLSGGSFLGMMNLLGGGGLSKFSIFALGVTPYITASIIVQLLSSDVVPQLSRLNRQGEKGRIKLEKITRLVAIFIAVIQGLAITMALNSFGVITITGTHKYIAFISIDFILVTGSLITIWIADQITISGIGSGVSIIIVVGIISRFPSKVIGISNFFIPSHSTNPVIFMGIMEILIYFLIGIGIIYIIAFFETSERRLPIQQTGQGLNLNKDKQTYLPIKINPAGVIPVIFASSVMTLFPTIAHLFPTNATTTWIIFHFSLYSVSGLIIFALLIVFFTFFYASININSVEMAESFQKSSTFIMGIKSGEDTQKFISKTVTTISILGAILLTSIAILPYVVAQFGVPQAYAIGGTSVIIVVTVMIDTWDQLKARLTASETINLQKGKVNKLRESDKSKTNSSDTILFN